MPQARRPVEGTQAFLADITLDHPWADPDIPSLVGVDEQGRVAGMIAVHVRRLRVGDRTIRAACCSHLAIRPDDPPSALGARILTRFMAGPQELAFSDTAIEVVARIWQTAGGRVDHGRSTTWVRPLRPLAFGGRSLAGAVLGRRVASGLTPIGRLPMALAAAKAVRRRAAGRPAEPPSIAAAPHDAPALETRPLRPEDVVAHAQSISGWMDVRAAWDEPFARWTFEAVQRRFGRDRVVARMLLRNGVPVGWYVYARVSASQGRVLHVAARRREVDATVGALFAGARADGVVLLRGRVEPYLAEALRSRGCALGFGDRFVMHGDDDVLGRMAGSGALVNKLEGEWWA